MKKMNTKNRSQTIRKCINLVMFQETNIDRMNDIYYKLNRLLYRETFIKDLLAQFFFNMGFAKNISLESDRCYQEFLKKYKDRFMQILFQ